LNKIRSPERLTRSLVCRLRLLSVADLHKRLRTSPEIGSRLIRFFNQAETELESRGKMITPNNAAKIHGNFYNRTKHTHGRGEAFPVD